MRKIVINTPKGGVGKTTTAINIALLLARQGHRVWAVDLAGGLLMSQALSNTNEFSNGSNNRIDPREAQRIPERFNGAAEFDFAVLDTDDSFTVGEDLLLGSRAGWRVIAPVNPHDHLGLERIPRDIRAVATTAFLSPSELKVSVVTNMAHGGDQAQGVGQLRQALINNGVERLLVNTVLPYGYSENAPNLLNDLSYNDALNRLLEEIGL